MGGFRGLFCRHRPFADYRSAFGQDFLTVKQVIFLMLLAVILLERVFVRLEPVTHRFTMPFGPAFFAKPSYGRAEKYSPAFLAYFAFHFRAPEAKSESVK